MKYLLLSLLTLALACGVPKKETRKEPTKPKKKEIVVKKTIEKPKVLKSELIVVFRDPNKIEDDKSLIKNSGLTFNKMIYDKKTSKIGIITVPEGKQGFWLNKLQKTNAFKLVNINNKKILNDLIKKEENLLVSIRKTPCFGDCTVYDVTINKEGSVTYYGTKYVLKKGKHEFKLSDKEFEKLNAMLTVKSFDEFNDIYDNPAISDLPSTFIIHKGKQVKIRLWKNIPDELINIHEYIEGILLDKKFFE